jgi:zinc transport system substrate-binding protein
MLLLVAGCTDGEIEAEASGPAVSVVTTIFPMADVIRELGGEMVIVSYLLPPGASPHTYEPTVEQARLIEDAHLFVYVGAGMDDWAAKLADAAGQQLILVNLAERVDLLESGSYGHHGSDDHDHHDCDHDHGPADPHFWLDPIVVRDFLCPALTEQLVLIDPQNEDYFRQKLDRFSRELTVLHEEIEDSAAGFSHDSFIAFHSAWQYFGRRYGLNEVAVVAEFPGQEPSAGWLAELIELIEEEDIGAIFAEPQFSTAMAERIAEESGLEMAIIDPLGGENVPGRESYLDLMRYNLAAISAAMN